MTIIRRDGELALQQSGAQHLILRTSWVVGAHGANFAKTMLRLAAERDSLNVVADQYGAPTSAALLADITAHLVRQCQREGKQTLPFGTYHLVAGGETNWCDYARFVVAAAHKAGKALQASPETFTQSPLPTTRCQRRALPTRGLIPVISKLPSASSFPIGKRASTTYFNRYSSLDENH